MIARFLRLDYLDQAIVVLSAALLLTFTVICAAEARRMWKKRTRKSADPLHDQPKGITQ